MVLKRDEFAGLTVERAANNQRQLPKFESKEKDRCSRDRWRERSNPRTFLPGIMIATGVVSMRSWQNFVKGCTFRGNRDVKVG